MDIDCARQAARSGRIFVVLCTLLLVLGGYASAQQQETTDTPPSSEQTQDRTYLGNERIESCMQRWDPGTHMTKEAWRASCERIKEEREPYVKGR